jgi:hypothetical protein
MLRVAFQATGGRSVMGGSGTVRQGDILLNEVQRRSKVLYYRRARDIVVLYIIAFQETSIFGL